jgi:MFS family permease
MTVRGYAALLRARGAPRIAASFLALGTANTMTPVAFVLFARSATHSFGSASLVLAASTAGGLLFRLARGRLVDRLGPRDAVLLLAIPDIATDVAFIAGGHARIGAGFLVALAFIAGAVPAPASTALRSVWSETLAESESRQAGYALMTMMQETTYIAGPLIAGALIALWSPTAAVAATALLSFVGAVAFAAPQPARRGPKPHKPGAPSGARWPRDSYSRRDVSRVRPHLRRPRRGVPRLRADARLGCGGRCSPVGVRSRKLGRWIPLRTQANRRAAGERYPVLCVLAAAGLAPLILTPSLPAIVILALLSGLCFAPITTCQLAVIDEVAQPEHKAEAFSWLGTLYGTGLALGAALSGQLVTAGGSRAALHCRLRRGSALMALRDRARTKPPSGPAHDE